MVDINITANATLKGNGKAIANGTITWEAPSFPNYINEWISITISGMWTWTGKGVIKYVAIGGINTSDSVPFAIEISNYSSPLSIACLGKTGQSKGSYFSWTDLTVTYSYIPILSHKINGDWKEVINVYKKENGIWIAQDSLETLFSEKMNYAKMN